MAESADVQMAEGNANKSRSVSVGDSNEETPPERLQSLWLLHTLTQTQVTEEVDQRVGCEVDQLKRQINADST